MLRVLLLGEPGTRSDSLGRLLLDAGHAVETLPASRLMHLEALVTEQVKAAADTERDLTVMTAAQALVQRIEKNPHAS